MIRIRQIEINVLKNQEEELFKKVAHLLKIRISDIKKLSINRRSIDARKKPDIFYVYEVDVLVNKEDNILLKNKNNNILKSPNDKYFFNIVGNKKLNNRPLIVGSGPAGLMAAYMLAENGYNPLILERGECIEKRVKTVEKFFKTGILNLDSNVQFGEGGAGTFSDGKLNTLVKDKFKRQRRVFEIFVECGAPREILYLNNPHIGTDILRKVVVNIRKKIIQMGGEFRYNSCVTDFVIDDKKIKAVKVNDDELIETDVLILAIGHSARDTFEVLEKKGILMKSKPFAVGIRIQHPQEMIGFSQYGPLYQKLPKASYKLTYKAKNGRGVYTFCMCPGGYVINSSSENGCLVINGMSNYMRDSKNANSAIIVTIGTKDFGEKPLDGVKFQRLLEEKAYQIGKGKIPIQLYKDFKNGDVNAKIENVEPVMKGKYFFSDIRKIFPSYITEALIEAIDYFDSKIEGFARDDAIIAAVESRTSSPVRIERDEFGESNIKGIFPCGEGAGYAGGITSSAMDGIYQAENILKVYNKLIVYDLE